MKEAVSKVETASSVVFKFLEGGYAHRNCITCPADSQAQYGFCWMLLPPDLHELIASNHPVRVANAILDKIDISKLVAQYKPGGTCSYRPGMLLKVLVYAYINNVYSSRMIEEAVAQNICYMWLSGRTGRH